MQQENKRYRIHQGVGAPPPNSGPPRKWADIPLNTIEIGDLIELPMEKSEVEKKIASVRSYVWRESKKLRKKFSVRKTDFGIGIWRVEKLWDIKKRIWNQRNKR